MWFEIGRLAVSIGRHVPQMSGEPPGIWVGYRTRDYKAPALNEYGKPNRFAPRFDKTWMKACG